MRVRKPSLERSILLVAFTLLCFQVMRPALASLTARPAGPKTRLAIIGLDHDHVWGLLKDLAAEPDAELVAIAEPRPALVNQAKSKVPANVKFYSDYLQMLDEAKPEAVIVTTEDDRK